MRDVCDRDCEREFYRVTLQGAISLSVDGQAYKQLSG